MKIAYLLPILALCGCAEIEISQPPILVTPKNTQTSSGIDVYARDRQRGNTVPSFRGQENIQVRTFATAEGGAYGEVSAANCILDSGLYSAQFQTPANIGVPDYGPNSPSVFIRCEMDGKTGSGTFESYNLTAAQRNSSAAGTGILGAIIIGAVAAAHNDPANDEYSYPAATIQLK